MGRLGTRRVWIAASIAFVAFAAVFFASSAGFSIPTVREVCGSAPPDVRPFSTGTQVHDFLVACGPAGRHAYRNLQVADLLYPLVFGVFVASSLAIALRRLAPRHPRLVALAAVALLATAFDYLENVCAWLALAAFPEPAATDGLLGVASALKTATSWVAGLLLVGAVAALAAGWVGRRRAHRPVAR